LEQSRNKKDKGTVLFLFSTSFIRCFKSFSI